ncbi:MAG: helix-hairpin-helix domain-containing protein [Candidatus Thorarchaeota archaeon]|jgi:meiotic recombination protein SPO11
MSKKKKSNPKKTTVQSTLGDLVEPKKKESAKKSSKKTKTSAKKTTKVSKTKPKKAAAKKKPELKTKPKKAAAKRKPKPKAKPKKAMAKEKPKPKAKPKKAAAKEKPKPKAETPKTDVSEPQIPLNRLSGIGPKLESRLIKAGYISVAKISRARSDVVARKVDGLSKAGAKKLTIEAKEIIRSLTIPDKPPITMGDATDSAKVDDDFEEVPTRDPLTALPGVGAKLAQTLERSGYDSIGRLSRSNPQSVSKKVEGLGRNRAATLIAAAKDYERTREMRAITGEHEIAVAPKKMPVKEEAEVPTPKKEDVSKKPETRKKPAKKPVKEPTKKKPKKRKKTTKKRIKIVRGDSGLKIPKTVADLQEELIERWAEAEKRESTPSIGRDDSKMVETVQVVSMTANETNERLVDTALEMLNETMTTGRPAFEIPSRSSDNIVWDEIRDLLLLGMRTISRPYHSLASVVDATRTARVMEIIYQLLQANLHATKREVFYSDVNLFRDQKYSDKIIEDVASMLQTTRDSVHVVASARGSAMGRVVIRDGGDRIDLTQMGTGGWAITPFLDQLEILESDAEFIILSEKDAAVMRLAEAKYWNRQPCIVLTGKGSGDIATRAFLKKLVKELEIPAFALVDSDPYGHYIYSVFLRGSKRLSYESPFIATPELKLLGVLSRDLDAFNIPKSVRIPMEPTDIKRVREMLKEPFVQKNKEWVEDLQLMLRLKEKAEIQAFASHSFQYLTDEYLPTKLETGDWI